ncbi:DUF397 domain-containing protein [Rhizomonospora bruguierae]|uniref:DUF397 domain-containing protein n=1 Tax=Rhizomonospora bruguierae TaxID=1581705 RepID=UPI001BCE61D8|nr:DUF397 domain-containing protein [Micromonospora sp. NBRC 107566]
MEQALDFTGARWFKSSSSGDGGCVEVAMAPTAVGIRDSKTANSPVLVVSRESWVRFVAGVKADEFGV